MPSHDAIRDQQLMLSPEHYRQMADAVLLVHVGVVLFVVGGLLLIVLGNLCRWRWVNALWFRALHLLAITVVVAESWFGVACPLTTLEFALRERAGAATYTGDFVAHWLQRVLYLDLPTWAFTLAYSLFALLVIATWWKFPPNGRVQRR